MGRKIGLNGKLYRGTAGTTAATLMTNVRDLSTPDELGEVDISTRGCLVELVAIALEKFSIDFQMLVDPSDADYTAIRAAKIARGPLAFKVLSDTDGHGMDADFVITKFSEGQPLREGQAVDVTIKPTYMTRYPAFV